MELFHGRPMAVCGVLAVLAAAAGYYLRREFKLALIAASLLAVLFLCLFFALGKAGKYRFICGVFVVLTVAGVLARSVAYYDSNYDNAKSVCARAVPGQSAVSGSVRERRFFSDYMTVYDIALDSVDGNACDMRAYLVCEYVSELQPGYIFTLSGCAVTTTLSGGRDDARLALADGVFLSVTSSDPDLCITTGRKAADPRSAFLSVNRFLSGILTDSVPGDGGALAAALLLGNRQFLDEGIVRDFSRAGVSHLIAVSGLHLSVLAGVLGWLLRLLGAGKRARYTIVTVFAFSYLCVIGFPVSAVRAAVMLLFVLVARLAGAVYDSVSALGAAACLILIVDPVSLLDPGFMLSFLATLGIVVFMPYFKALFARIRAGRDAGSRPLYLINQFCGYIVFPILTVVAVYTVIILAIWLLFGEISLAAPLSNLILTPASSFLLMLCAVFLPLSPIPVISDFLAFYIKGTAGFIIKTAGNISDVRGSVLSLSYPFVPYILIPFGIMTAIFMIVRLKHKFIALTPVVAAVLAFAVCLPVYNAQAAERAALTCLSDGEGESIVLITGRSATVIDVSDGSYSYMSDAMERAQGGCAVELSALVLTHYHVRHVFSVSRLLSREKIEYLWLPYPADTADAGLMLKLCESAAAEGCICIVYRPGEENTLPDGTRFTAMPGTGDGNTHPTLAFTLSFGVGDCLAYIGKGYIDDGTAGMTLPDVLILGAHGPSGRDTALHCGVSPDTVVICDGIPPESVVCPDSGMYETVITADTLYNVNIWCHNFEK